MSLFSSYIIIFFGEISIKVFGLIFNWVVGFLSTEFLRVLHNISCLSDVVFYKIFSLIL